MAFVYKTASGSKHYVDHENLKYMRVPDENFEDSRPLRRDDELLKIFITNTPKVGECLEVVLEPLGEGSVTLRRTSPVVEIQEA